MDRHPCAVNAGLPQRRPGAGRLARVVGHADHGQLGALGQGERQPSFAAAVVDRVALADAGGRENRLGGGAAFAHSFILGKRRRDGADVPPSVVEIGFASRRGEPLDCPLALDTNRVVVRGTGRDPVDRGFMFLSLVAQVNAVAQRGRGAVGEAGGHRLSRFPANDRPIPRGKRQIGAGAQVAVAGHGRRLGSGGVAVFCAVVAIANLLAGEGTIVDSHPGDEAFERKKLVVVEVAADDERGRRVVDGSPALTAAAALDAVDVESHPRAVEGADDVIPSAGLVRDGGVQVGEVATGGKGEVEFVVVVAKHPAFLETAVVLQAANDAAPFGGGVHSHPRLGGELVFRQRLGLLLAGQLDVGVRSVEVERGGLLNGRHPPVQKTVLIAGEILHRGDIDIRRRQHPLIHRTLRMRGNEAEQQ